MRCVRGGKTDVAAARAGLRLTSFRARLSKRRKFCSRTTKTFSGVTEDDHSVKPSKSEKHTWAEGVGGGERSVRGREEVTGAPGGGGEWGEWEWEWGEARGGVP